jgi:hypothetical protein
LRVVLDKDLGYLIWLEGELMVMYNVIIRRTRRKDLVSLLMTAGFLEESARSVARKVKNKCSVVYTAHFERAEFIVSRIRQVDKELKVDMVASNI